MNSFLILVAILLSGCASISRPVSTKVIKQNEPLKLQLQPRAELNDLTHYHSQTLTQVFSDGEIRKKSLEGLDFSVRTILKTHDADKGLATYKLTTVKKDGKADLSDFAMPELDESIELTLNAKAKVLQAGDIPRGTIYYVPPISLPENDVEVGDSWTLTAEWLSLKSGIPLRMEVVSILKSVRDCGASGPCAEIEVSGDVAIVGLSSNPIVSRDLSKAKIEDLHMRFQSNINGRLLFSIQQGLVLYSVMRSNESLSGVAENVQVASCMLSYIDEPKNFKIASAATECQPDAELPMFP